MDQKLAKAFVKSRHRLFLLDYDGTLQNFAPTPDQAAPTQEIKQLLNELAADPANTVVIVSGRDHPTLDSWLGELPVQFVAEHGMAHRSQGREWQFAKGLPTGWQAPVRSAMQKGVNMAPGSFIEAKSNSLVWHYRVAKSGADKAFASLLDDLVLLTKKHGLRILRGNKAVEVQPAGVDKGSCVRRWFDLDKYDFILAIGDDVTDEDLFRAMPTHAYTVKVGPGDSSASQRVPKPAAVQNLLTSLASGT